MLSDEQLEALRLLDDFMCVADYIDAGMTEEQAAEVEEQIMHIIIEQSGYGQ